MYSILQPKSEVANVNERFMHGSPLSAVLRTNLMFLTYGIWKFVRPNSAATTPATAAMTPAIAAIVLTIKRIISKVSSFVSAVFFHTVILPHKGGIFLTRHRFMKSALFICITLISIITYTLSIAETIFDDRTKSSKWADVTIVVLAVGFFLSYWV